MTVMATTPTNWLQIAGEHADRHQGELTLKYLEAEKVWRVRVIAKGPMHSGEAKADGIQAAGEKLCQLLHLTGPHA